MSDLKDIFTNQGVTCLSSLSADWFARADNNFSKGIDPAEFKEAMEAVGLNMSSEENDILFGHFDEDSSGIITYGEFAKGLRGEMPQFSAALAFMHQYTGHFPSNHDALRAALPEFDASETEEWLESLNAVIQHHGKTRARFLLHELIEEGARNGVHRSQSLDTPLVNTIPSFMEKEYPGDQELERRISNIVRWNAATLVSDANRRGGSVGGHIGTFASICDVIEVGMNHFFRGKDYGGGRGDSVWMQGHAAPGAYSRAFLEGRLSVEQIMNFRRESQGAGLSSYPHPRLMPKFWENPTVSMGLGPLGAVYQARFFRYLHLRGLADTSKSRVWAFVGDGEMDEPESITAISVAGRERLNNMIFIVNCNYQRLDGPVRGNSKVIQEFEGTFRGAGFDVIKLVWGGRFSELIENDQDGKLIETLENIPDGDCQRLHAKADGALVRKDVFEKFGIADRVAHWSDEELLEAFQKPGGHDKRKIYAAMKQAETNAEEGGRPTAILVKTLKGYSLQTFLGRNTVHQKKMMSDSDMTGFRDLLNIPITDEQLKVPDAGNFYHPGPESPEVQYVQKQRAALGGFLPCRKPAKVSSLIELPTHEEAYAQFDVGTTRDISTTMAFAQILRKMMQSGEFGQRITLMVTDESRTFGLDAFFPIFKIHAPFGQNYTPVDADQVMKYAEAPNGQILQEGISEGGAIMTWIASATSYASQQAPTLPFFIYYSMFGFQRVGDSIWQAADMRSRGFLIGGTYGRPGARARESGIPCIPPSEHTRGHVMRNYAGVVPSGELSPREMTRLLQQSREEERQGAARALAVMRRTRLCASGLAFALVGLAVVAIFRPLESKGQVLGAHEAFEAKSEVSMASSYQCLDSYELSDFSSKGNMELAGWSFNWDDEFTFKPPIYQMYAPSTAYWGCSKHGGGTISLTLQGQGVLTLDFGNSWGNESSSVTVFLNGAKQEVAGPYTFSKTVKIPFNDGDTLDIVEGPSGVIVINSITFRCVATTTPTPTTTTTLTDTTTMSTTTTTITTRTNDVLTETATTTTASTTTSTATTSTQTSTTAWKDIEEAKRKWLKEYDELQRKRLEERKKKEQLEHQLELERSVLDKIRKEREELKKATEREKKALAEARAERAKEQKRRDELLQQEKHKSDEEAKEKEEAEEDKKAKEEEERQREEQTVTRETKLAQAVAKQKRHTKEQLHKLMSERKEEQREEEVMAEHMEKELEKADDKEAKAEGSTSPEPTAKPDLKAPSLYCYSLMLPFGYEPALLRAQKDRGVGIFACDEYAVFSNSTRLLDKDAPSPVKVSLLNFSLAVPYGGKWHTALNTGVFNGVWTTIVSLGNYRMHDWVVKADPDSVFFPDRLVNLLLYRRPMSEMITTASSRRLDDSDSPHTRRLDDSDSPHTRRLQWNVPSNATCGKCRMPGFEGQSCNSHVQYIQQQGHSCSEALRRVARSPPTDCGCVCNRIESCDFKMDPKMYRNYQVIKGKAYPGAVYINNCKFGLHGPIEVLSQRAVTAYVEGLPQCNNLLVHPWGEDKFMDRCMLELGITRVNEFGLLNEIACGQTPAPCGDANVAFHPFKSIHSYFACWEYADRYGRGPEDPSRNDSSHYVV